MEEKDSFVILTRILGQKERASDELGTSVCTKTACEPFTLELGVRGGTGEVARSAPTHRAHQSTPRERTKSKVDILQRVRASSRVVFC